MMWVYRALVAGALPVVLPILKLRDRTRGKRRPPFAARFARRLPVLPTHGVWVHAVSVGEVEIARRLLRELGEDRPGVTAFVTATTATGLDLARRTLPEAVPVLPSPIDIPGAVRRVLDAGRPQAVVIVETELWPEMLHQTAARGIPAAVVNARLSDTSFRRYRRLRGFFAPLLRSLHLVLARSRADGERFAELGVPHDAIEVVGNIKYDLEPDPTPLEWADAVRAAAGSRPIVVAGSTMEGEESIVLEAVGALGGGGRRPLLILAPRHPERFDAVAELVERRGSSSVRRSTDAAPGADTEVFLLDTIGELGRAYQLAAAAFVGGSLAPTGGHNPLEPALWGVPVLSGPHVHNFTEVYDEMTAAGAARIVADGGDLGRALRTWLDDRTAATAAGAAGRAVVEANRGATGRTVVALRGILDGAGRG
jgi:3-deoxy-D-manno-octulosonic-acid transferase